MRGLRKTALSVLGVFAAVLGMVGTAHAGPQHHGTNPASTGCATGSYAIASHPVRDGAGAVVTNVEVRYSPSCGTNWVRLYNPVAGTTAHKAIRVAGGAWLPDEADYGQVWSYSMQVYAPGSTCIEYSVTIENASYQASTGPYIIVVC